jgi:hypothetical protein
MIKNRRQSGKAFFRIQTPTTSSSLGSRTRRRAALRTVPRGIQTKALRAWPSGPRVMSSRTPISHPSSRSFRSRTRTTSPCCRFSTGLLHFSRLLASRRISSKNLSHRSLMCFSSLRYFSPRRRFPLSTLPTKPVSALPTKKWFGVRKEDRSPFELLVRGRELRGSAALARRVRNSSSFRRRDSPKAKSSLHQPNHPFPSSSLVRRARNDRFPHDSLGLPPPVLSLKGL